MFVCVVTLSQMLYVKCLCVVSLSQQNNGDNNYPLWDVLYLSNKTKNTDNGNQTSLSQTKVKGAKT